MRKLYLFLSLFSLSQPFFAQPDLVFSQIASVPRAVDITGAGDGTKRLFIVNQTGIIRIFDQNTNTLLTTPFLDITDRALFGGERGLLGLTFHPNFETNGFFYVNYVDETSGDTKISRFTASPYTSNTVLASTELVIITIDQPTGAGFTNHKAGDLNFGPDGYLYVATGDGGSGGDPGNRAQNPQDLLGKMLRIDVDNPANGNNYGIPADNPFVGTQSPTDYRDEIWALGLRNPWRFSFDSDTGDMYIADVGQGAREEINFEPSGSAGGRNYGWRCYEGNQVYDTDGCLPIGNYTFPVFEYDHSANGGQSVTGGFVYRGTDAPTLAGWYILTDYVSANFWLLKRNGASWIVDFQPDVNVGNITAFGEDDEGELFATRLSGPIYSVTSSPLPIELLGFQGKYEDGRVRLTWSTATERNGAYFDVERKTNDAEFKEIGQVNAMGESNTVQAYHFEDRTPADGENVYRLKMVDRDGSFEYSQAISIQISESHSWQLSPNPAADKVSLVLNKAGEAASLRLAMTNMEGKEVLSLEENSPAFPYEKELGIGELPPGIYFCKMEMNGKTEFKRLVINR